MYVCMCVHVHYSVQVATDQSVQRPHENATKVPVMLARNQIMPAGHHAEV